MRPISACQTFYSTTTFTHTVVNITDDLSMHASELSDEAPRADPSDMEMVSDLADHAQSAGSEKNSSVEEREAGVLDRLRAIGPKNIAYAALSAGLRDGACTYVARLVGSQASNAAALMLTSTAGTSVVQMIGAVAGATSVGTGTMYGYSMGKTTGESVQALAQWAKNARPEAYSYVSPFISCAKQASPYVEKIAPYIQEVAPIVGACVGATLGGTGYALTGPTGAIGNIIAACTRSFLQQRVAAPYGSNVQWKDGKPNALYIFPAAIGYGAISVGVGYTNSVTGRLFDDMQVGTGECTDYVSGKFNEYLAIESMSDSCKSLMVDKSKSLDNPLAAVWCSNNIGTNFAKYLEGVSDDGKCRGYIDGNVTQYVKNKLGLDSGLVQWVFKPLVTATVTGVAEAVDGVSGTVCRAAAPGSKFEEKHPIDAKFSSASFRKEATSRIYSTTAGGFINGTATRMGTSQAKIVGNVLTGVLQEYRGATTAPVVKTTNEYFHGWFDRRAPIDQNTMADTHVETASDCSKVDDNYSKLDGVPG
jgi:hypothetical protein